jgi:hypothetical protein
MVLQLFTKAAEAKLVHTLEDIRERPEAWQAMHFHLSDLLEQYKSEYQIKIAINLIHDLLKGFNGYIFVVNNYSIVVLCYGLDAPLRSKLVFQLRYLYMDDPLAYTDSGQENQDFCTIYNLSNDLKEFLEICSRLMKSARPASGADAEGEGVEELEPNKPEDRIKQPQKPLKKGELSVSLLAMIERDLDHADLNRVIRRQPICAVQDSNTTPRRVFDELYTNIAHLRQMLRAEADFLSDRWLFKYLTHILDQRMIALLRHNPGRYLGSPVSLNFNVQTLLSPAFAEFDATIKPATKVAVIIEVPVVDVFADTAAYNTARTEVQKLGYRICLDGLSTESFVNINREKLGADLVKVQWNADRETDLQTGIHSDMTDAVQATGTNRIILCRCDNKNAIQYGQALGISLFQGRYLDKQLNPNAKVEN